MESAKCSGHKPGCGCLSDTFMQQCKDLEQYAMLGKINVKHEMKNKELDAYAHMCANFTQRPEPRMV